MKDHSTNLLGFTPTLDGQSAQTSIRPIESAPPPDVGDPYPLAIREVACGY
jgi:hypothetical protein